jgi:uncharacterized protein
MTPQQGAKLWVSLGLGLLLMGCSPPTATTPDSSTDSSPVMQTNPTVGQTLPITAQTTIAGKLIQLEVARTPQEQATGLMGRTSLADDRGMLFLFSPPRPTQFWMKNTLINLDMIFIRNGIVKAIAANVPPCKADPCPTYGSMGEVIDQVIELRGGRSAELGLKVGDRVPVQFLNPSQTP